MARYPKKWPLDLHTRRQSQSHAVGRIWTDDVTVRDGQSSEATSASPNCGEHLLSRCTSTTQLRSQKASVESPPTPSNSRKYVHFVNTLDPNRLTARDYLDLSGRWSTDVKITTRSLLHHDEMTSPMGIESTGSPPIQYLPNTGGFFYLRKASEGVPETAA